MNNQHTAGEKPGAATPLPLWIFGSTIFISAFLLFQIQPLISKIILPWFGGGSLVWTISMVFFQVLLLGGYAYAHIINRFSSTTQGRVHLAVLGLIATWLIVFTLWRGNPILPGARLKPDPGEIPAWQVLWILTSCVGIPYLLLSTTSSLAQAWFTKVERRISPYSFYALSNVASLLSLLSYPIIFEPMWKIRQQAAFWTAGFGLYLVFAATCAVFLLRGAQQIDSTPKPAANPVTMPDTGIADKPTFKRVLSWIGLATCSTSLLLAVTNQMTMDIASVPFLWVIPLSLYLFSFVIAFSRWFQRFYNFILIVAFFSLFFGFLTVEAPDAFTFLQLTVGNAVLLFFTCLLCNFTLYALRPHPNYLTSFYLSLSIGGAVGGALVSLIAPLTLPDYWEYHLALLAVALVAILAATHRRGNWIFHLRHHFLVLTIGLAALLGGSIMDWMDNSVATRRNFYGVVRVREIEYEDHRVHNLVHGRIIHGSQSQEDDILRFKPTRYYSPMSGIGLAFNHNPRRGKGMPLRAGMVGLGAGTVAAYGRPGDTIRFYEINPIVIDIAQDNRYFTYLKDSPAKIEIVLGDARLSMEKETMAADFRKYDLLAIDAFSSDSIPTHLMSREAFGLYLSLLTDDGILAIHISNRYLDLETIVGRLAQEYGLYSGKYTGGESDWMGSGAVWILLSRSPSALSDPNLVTVRQPLVQIQGQQVWTDDYTNLFETIRR